MSRRKTAHQAHLRGRPSAGVHRPLHAAVRVAEKKYSACGQRQLHYKGIKNLDQEILKTKGNINRLNQQLQEGKKKKLSVYNKSANRQILAVDKRYNDTLGQIKSLRDELDRLRQEKNRLTSQIDQVKGEIDSLNNNIARLDEQTQKCIKKQAEINRDMVQERSQHEKQKSVFYAKMIQLDKSSKGEQKYSGKSQQREVISTDTATILKNKVLKLIVNNKQKVKLIENYQRSMKAIDQAFNIIKEATGITDIEEIKTTFIKGEEQNYGLLTYVDVLSQEIHNLVSQNQELKIKNSELVCQNALKKQLLSIMPDDERRALQIEKICESKRQKQKQCSDMLKAIQQPFKQLMTAISKSHFKQTSFDDEGFSLILSNVNQHVSSLDEAITPLLLHVAKKNGKDNALRQMLMLEQLPKVDKKKASANYLAQGEDQVPKGELLDFKKLRELAQIQLKKRDIKPIKK